MLTALFLKNIYLFIWLCWVLVAARGIFVAACGIFRCGTRTLRCSTWALSGFGAWALELAGSVVVALRLSSCGAQAPDHTGSVVAVRGLSCPTAFGTLVPQPVIKPASPALEGGFLTTGPPGKSYSLLLIIHIFFVFKLLN